MWCKDFFTLSLNICAVLHFCMMSKRGRIILNYLFLNINQCSILRENKLELSFMNMSRCPILRGSHMDVIMCLFIVIKNIFLKNASIISRGVLSWLSLHPMLKYFCYQLKVGDCWWKNATRLHLINILLFDKIFDLWKYTAYTWTTFVGLWSKTNITKLLRMENGCVCDELVIVKITSSYLKIGCGMLKII